MLKALNPRLNINKVRKIRYKREKSNGRVPSLQSQLEESKNSPDFQAFGLGAKYREGKKYMGGSKFYPYSRRTDEAVGTPSAS